MRGQGGKGGEGYSPKLQFMAPPLVIYVFCRLVILVRLSVTVQVIDWKDSSRKRPVMC